MGKKKKRINYDNLCVWLTNWNGEYKIIERFQNLPFKNKICFVNKKYNNCSNIVYLNCNKKRVGMVSDKYIEQRIFLEKDT